MVLRDGRSVEAPPGHKVKRAVHTRVTEVKLRNFGHNVLSKQAIFEFEESPLQAPVPLSMLRRPHS